MHVGSDRRAGVVGRSRRWSYTGHYVVLTGIDARGRVTYKDPASSAGEAAIPVADLHRARTAHGTDEDLILVAADSVGAPPSASSGGAS